MRSFSKIESGRFLFNCSPNQVFLSMKKGQNMYEKKDEYINCRLTKNERSALNIMANSEGRSVSEMLRELIRECAKRRGLNNFNKSIN